MAKSIYLIGSLRNEQIPVIGNLLRADGWDAFDDWYGAGHEADDKWQAYEKLRGRSYRQALYGHAAKSVFQFDNEHLERCDLCVLVMPAGRSGHMEFGHFTSKKPGFVLFEQEPERYDVMYQFATDVFFSPTEMIQGLQTYK